MKEPKICVVGLGYVGLPLAHAFARKGYKVFGFDINATRIEELKAGKDHTRELTEEQLRAAPMVLSADPRIIAEAKVVILAIPTPVDAANKPDLSMLKAATETVGEHLAKGSIVVYESTVYPGTTEEICGPILEETSGLRCGTDFTLGYSPERINPGDKEHTVEKIIKVVSAQDQTTLDALSELYGSVTKAGVHRAPSIQVAEMAKAIENAQRDLNIAFMNEVAILCGRLGIQAKDVLAAARTKWNFLPFQPGLVGGHCIGVDPYYLVEKARQLGMKTQIIAAGRMMNESMSAYVAIQVGRALKTLPGQARVLVLGLTFKEDVPDTRNSKSPEVALQLQALGCSVEVHDPSVPEEQIRSMGLIPGSLAKGPYDAVLLLVPHREYRELPADDFIRATKAGGVIYDLKSILDRRAVECAGRKYLAL